MGRLNIFIPFSLLLLLLHCSVYAKHVEVYTESLPPFQIMASDQVVGSATEQVKNILKGAQLSYQVHVVPWARAYNIVKSTPNTLIYSINRTPEREPYFYWIAVVGEIANSFISLASNTHNITQLAEAQNYVTAVVRDGYAHEILAKQGFIADKNMYVVATLEQQISLLLSGKIEFVFTDIQSIRYTLKLKNIDPNRVKVNFTQNSWTRDLFLAANINSEPEILRQLGVIFSAQLP